jgi:uncharacterized protein YoxC
MEKNLAKQNKELLDNIIKTLNEINKRISNLEKDVKEIKSKTRPPEEYVEVNKSWFF